MGLGGPRFHTLISLGRDRYKNGASGAAFMRWWGFVLMYNIVHPLFCGWNFTQLLVFHVGAAGGISWKFRYEKSAHIELHSASAEDAYSQSTGKLKAIVLR